MEVKWVGFLVQIIIKKKETNKQINKQINKKTNKMGV